MKFSEKINLLIVEDHALTLFGLKTVLNAQSFVNNIYEAQNGTKALTLISNNNIDIAVIDLGLPDCNGIELCQKIKDISKDIKIIILTSHNNKDEVIESLKQGAMAYCSKETETDLLCDVIKHVHYGAMWIDPCVANIIASSLTYQQELSDKDVIEYNFTSREREILNLLINGYDNMEMAQKLSVSLHTIKAHICNVLQKLNVKDRTQAVIKAMRLLK